MITDLGPNQAGAPPPPPPPPAPMTNLPPFSGIQEVTTVHENGKWKIPGPGTPGEDNFGDGTMIADAIDGLYRMAYRSGGTTNGCVYVQKTLDGDPYHGWSVPNGPADPLKAFPAGVHITNSVNVDTACLARNPATGVITEVNNVKPGSVSELEAGHISAIQRRTSKAPHTNLHLPGNWNTFAGRHEVEVQVPPATWQQPRIESLGPPVERSGGIDESSIFLNPFTGLWELWYEAKSFDEADSQWGTTWKNRLGMVEADPADFDTAPVWVPSPALGATSWRYDPQDDPRYVTIAESETTPQVWGTMPGFTQRAHVSVDPATGIRHMVAIAQRPAITATEQNASTGIGHWWEDAGAWVQDVNNPLISAASLGWTETVGVNWVNSPFLMWTPTKLYLGFWANQFGNVNQLGNKLWLMEASLT